uniref:Uncharacterized protein n=1 Tax=Tetraselmis sp. GSL018 TaxID=582737 RepID=A0A061RGH7_9CHLO
MAGALETPAAGGGGGPSGAFAGARLPAPRPVGGLAPPSGCRSREREGMKTGCRQLEVPERSFPGSSAPDPLLPPAPPSPPP